MIRTTPTLSVFTPAYNRAHTIWRTYESLCRQTSKDFKWVIVDDGSKDNTQELVEEWLKKDNGFVIEYYWKENGGMHTAHNAAYEHIDTELAVCIDSDDWMPDDGVEVIINKWRKEGAEKYAGMIGLDIYADGSVIGTKFPEGLKECKTYDLARKHKVFCDKKYVYRPEIIKKYLPYPVYPGERYGEVNFLYQKIDNDYDMLCGNDIFCVVEYQEDGLTRTVLFQHKQSPLTRAYECETLIQCLPYFSGRFKHAAQYDACAFLAKKPSMIFKSSNKLLKLLGLPIGIAFYFHVLKHTANRK